MYSADWYAANGKQVDKCWSNDSETPQTHTDASNQERDDQLYKQSFKLKEDLCNYKNPFATFMEMCLQSLANVTYHRKSISCNNTDDVVINDIIDDSDNVIEKNAGE